MGIFWLLIGSKALKDFYETLVLTCYLFYLNIGIDKCRDNT